MTTPEERAAAGISAELSAAYDILTDDGVPPQIAADMLVAAQMAGHNPEHWARKFLKLRRALR